MAQLYKYFENKYFIHVMKIRNRIEIHFYICYTKPKKNLLFLFVIILFSYQKGKAYTDVTLYQNLRTRAQTWREIWS